MTVCKALQSQLSPLVVPAFFDGVDAGTVAGSASAASATVNALRPITAPLGAALATAATYGLPEALAHALVRQWLVFIDAMLFNGVLTRRPLTLRQLATLGANVASWEAWLVHRLEQLRSVQRAGAPPPPPPPVAVERSLT